MYCVWGRLSQGAAPFLFDFWTMKINFDKEKALSIFYEKGGEELIERGYIAGLVPRISPLEFLARHYDTFVSHARFVVSRYIAQTHRRTAISMIERRKYEEREKPPAGFGYGVSLMLAHLPPLYEDGGYIWIYRGMSKAEAAQIARGQYDDISYFWTWTKRQAAGYAIGGGVVCAALAPKKCIRANGGPEMSELFVPGFEAVGLAHEVRFYRPFASTILNKCCNLLIFKQLSRKIFGKYKPCFYLRLTNQKVSRYEIQQ